MHIAKVSTRILIFGLIWGSGLASASAQGEARTDSLLQRAERLQAQQNYEEAEIVYRQVLVLDQDSVPAMMGLGKIAHEMEEWSVAQDWFKKVLDLEPENQEAKAFFANPRLQKLLRQGDSLRVAKEFNAAEVVFQHALDINRESIPALMGMARVGYDKREWGKVKKWSDKIREIDPENKEIYRLLTTHPSSEMDDLIARGDALLSQANYDEAKDKYEDALDIYEGCIPAWRGLGQIAYHQQDWGGIKEWYGKVEDVFPEDLEAHYYLGIADRETGKFKSLLLKKIDYNKSENHFNFVIQADSTYRDVYYQRAVLERWREHYQQAVIWAERQVEVKPDMIPVRIGLFKFYRMLIKHSNAQWLESWLQRRDTVWATYFLGELYRRNDNFAEARKIFEQLLKEEPEFSPSLVYSSRVRLNLQQDRVEDANDFFELALFSADSELDTQFLYEDWKYIFRDEELETFRELSSADDKKDFFYKFWTRRNPLPASQINHRAMEHYRRLIFAEKNYWYDGLRSWGLNPDKVGYLRFPKAYFENKEFNDKGMVYLRHGFPDAVARTPGTLASNESWHYYKRADRPELILHFLKEERLSTGNNWKLVPNLPDLRMVQDRAGWDPKMDQLLIANTQQEVNKLQDQISDESYLQVKEAMASDTHTWAEATEELSMPYYISYFRSDAEGKTRVELYYALYLNEMFAGNGSSNEIELEHGAGIFDSQWNEIDEDFNEQTFEADASSNVFIYRYTADVEPGSYLMSLYAAKSGSRQIGGDTFEIDVPSRTSKSLQLSDLELAYSINPATEPGVFTTGEYEVIPNPAKAFKLSDPVHLYFEVYNLTPDKEGETRFEIEHTMKKTDEGGGLFGLFGGGDKEVISINNQRTGHDPTAKEIASFDVSKLEAGDYELEVTVKDRVSGKTKKQTIELMLVGE